MLWKPWWRVREGREEWPNRNDGKSWPKTKTFLLGSDLLKNNFIRKKARNKRWTWKIKLSTLIIQFQFIFDFLSNEVIFMRTKWQREKNEGKDCARRIFLAKNTTFLNENFPFVATTLHTGSRLDFSFINRIWIKMWFFAIFVLFWCQNLHYFRCYPSETMIFSAKIQISDLASF